MGTQENTQTTRQSVLSVIRGTGPGAFARGGPGAVPLRRGLLHPPASDPLGQCHLARFDPVALKVWIWFLLVRDHRNGLALGDRQDMMEDTGLSRWQIRRAIRWLQENPPGAPYVETVRSGGGGRPPLYRVLRDEALRGLREEAPDA